MDNKIYKTTKYKEWRRKVFRRDLFTCQLCGQKGSLEAHHIKKKSVYPQYMYTVSNGISLCVTCHKIVTRREEVFEPLFKRIVNRKLSISYIKSFFASLSSEIIEVLEYNKKLAKIPYQLVKKMKVDKSIKNVKRRTNSARR